MIEEARASVRFEESPIRATFREVLRQVPPGHTISFAEAERLTGYRLTGNIDDEVRRHRDLFFAAVQKEHPSYEAIPNVGVRVASEEFALADTRARMRRFVSSGRRTGQVAQRNLDRYGDRMGIHERQLLLSTAVQTKTLVEIARGSGRSLSAIAKSERASNDAQPMLPSGA